MRWPAKARQDSYAVNVMIRGERGRDLIDLHVISQSVTHAAKLRLQWACNELQLLDKTLSLRQSDLQSRNKGLLSLTSYI